MGGACGMQSAGRAPAVMRPLQRHRYYTGLAQQRDAAQHSAGGGGPSMLVCGAQQRDSAQHPVARVLVRAQHECAYERRARPPPHPVAGRLHRAGALGVRRQHGGHVHHLRCVFS